MCIQQPLVRILAPAACGCFLIGCTLGKRAPTSETRPVDDRLAAVQKLVEAVRAQYAPDKRVSVFDVTPELRDGRVVLRGETTVPAAREALRTRCAAAPLAVEDRVLLLPHPDLGDKVRALVNISVANLRSRPSHAAELVTQALLGMPLRVLKQSGDFYLVQTADDYIAWVDHGGIHVLSEAAYEELRDTSRGVYLRPWGACWSEPDTSSPTVSDLVMGALLFLDGEKEDFQQVRFPDGRRGWLPKPDVMPYEEWSSRAPPSGESIARAALALQGVPYLWGGASSKAVDCSGLVQLAYFHAGLLLPRDASQQALCGSTLDERDEFGHLRPGDLLFFGKPADGDRRERVEHVGLWIGDGRYVHASGRVSVASMDPSDPSYDAFNRGRYLRTRRILGGDDPQVRDLRHEPLY